MIKEKSMFCKNCSKYVMVRKYGLNHIFHLILSLITAGFWLIIWLLLIILNSFKNYRCTQCGSTNLSK